jgi:phosphoesterase RecJ-like protein
MSHRSNGLKKAVEESTHIVIVQAGNVDGDSVASSLALEEIFGDMEKKVALYAPTEVPKYLRYLKGWDRIVTQFPSKVDLIIIVDTVSDTLLSKPLETPGVRHIFETVKVYALDHHIDVASSLSFPHELVVSDSAVATGELIADICKDFAWPVNPRAAAALYASIMADSLGLTTEATTAESYRTIAWLIDQGAVPADLEKARRELMKKPPEILTYKAKLIERIEYYLDGTLAVIHIPWEEIAEYSDKYNPSMLVLDEMRRVEGVELAIALKTYPDGKITGKLRSNAPISHVVAGFFGGGGHAYSSGFRAYDDYNEILHGVIEATDKVLKEKKDA